MPSRPGAKPRLHTERRISRLFMVGSACFAVSSVLALPEARGHNIATRVAIENFAGSVAFGLSAIASYVVPNTDHAANAALATSGTLIGALLFYRAAQLLPRATERPA